MSKVGLLSFVLGLTIAPSYSMKNEEREISKNICTIVFQSINKNTRKELFLNFLKCLHKTMSMYKNPLKKIEATSLEAFSSKTAECSKNLGESFTALIMSFSAEESQLFGQELGSHFFKHLQGLVEGFSLVGKELKTLVNTKPELLLFITLQDLIIKFYSPEIVLLVNFFASRYDIDPKEIKEAMPMLHVMCKKFEDKKIFDETTYVKLDAKAVPRENLEVYKDAIIIIVQKMHGFLNYFIQQQTLTQNYFMLDLALRSQAIVMIIDVFNKLGSPAMAKLHSETQEKYPKYLICFLAESFKNFYKNNKDLLSPAVIDDLFYKEKASKASDTIGLLIKNLEKEMTDVLDGVYGKAEKKEEFLIA